MRGDAQESAVPSEPVPIRRLSTPRDTATGKALALISPDSEQTFATYLGAAVEMTASDIKSEHFEKCDLLHIKRSASRMAN